MKTVNKIILLLAFLQLVNCRQVISQVAISTDGSAPHSSAMLEIKSENKGLLLPRIDFNNRPNPAVAGLLIFVTANGPLGNNALYYYDGSGWVILASANILEIGQHIAGGVVFYVDPTGQHGLISAETDQSVWGNPWGDASVYIGPAAQGYAIGTGEQNSAAILAANSNPDIAANMCDTLTINGFNDWFLPSTDELDSLYVHREIVGGFQNGGWYWSSTEQDTEGAWLEIFDIPQGRGWTNKENGLSVRCIRSF
jgi:hypothetical protein